MADQVDLNFIARRLEQMGNDVSNVRDDITILTAMASRMESSITSLVQKMRATHSQMACFDNRLRNSKTKPLRNICQASRAVIDEGAADG
jgi:hypothetical protein